MAIEVLLSARSEWREIEAARALLYELHVKSFTGGVMKAWMGMAVVVAVGLAGCGDKDSSSSASASASAASTSSAKGGSANAAATTGGGAAKPAPAAADKPAKTPKTKLDQAKLKEVYDAVSKENDFKKHRAMYEEKLGKPVKEEGDKAFWFGIGKSGTGKDECYELYSSPTKGDSLGGGADDKNCWE